MVKDKSVSALSEFLSDAKISTYEMQKLYLMNVLRKYEIKRGYFIIDDTMNHHTKLCKWIHGASVIFYHVTKYLDKNFPVFYAPLKAGLQPAAHYCRVANQAIAMLENLWPST